MYSNDVYPKHCRRDKVMVEKNESEGHCIMELQIWRTREKAMAPHSSTLAWKIPWTEEQGGLQSIGLHRVGQD